MAYSIIDRTSRLFYAYQNFSSSMNKNNIAVISVLYKHANKLIKQLKTQIVKEGVNAECIYLEDNSKKNLGYAGAINKVLSKNLKKFKFFLIINPDIKIKKGAIRSLMSFINSSNRLGIVGPLILSEDKRIWGAGGEIDKKRYTAGLKFYRKKEKDLPKDFSVDFIPGTFMLIKREVFEKVGLLDDRYFLYYEDVDFCERAKKIGYEIAMDRNAQITHFASLSVGKNSPAMNYYMARNHLFFVERFAPISIKLRELLRFPKTIFKAKNNKYELLGIVDYLLRKFGRNSAILSNADNL